jgi:uncharacterized protein involved in type VI secretion and phage assembly
MALTSKVRIEIDGEDIKHFLYLNINQSMYDHHTFEVVCRKDTFESSDSFVMEKSKNFIGSTITIAIEAKKDGETESQPGLFFKGIITSIRATNQIILSGYSPDILLNDNPGNRSFENKNLKQIADDVLKPYPKDILKSQINPANKNQLPYIVQYNEKRYDFLRRLAIRYGEWFFYDGSELFFGSLPNTKINLTSGVDLSGFDFSIKLNPLNFKYIAYDYITARSFETSSSKSVGKNHLNEYGGFAYDKSVKQYSQQSTSLYNHLNTPSNNYTKELKNVVDLEEGASALEMSSVHGSSEILLLKLGCKVNIKALKGDNKGKVDYGEYIITSLTHTCDNLMNYKNSFNGIPAEAKIPDYTNPHAIPSCETQSAVVKDNNDPDKLGRVRVNFSWQEGNMMTPWIRIVNQHSGNNKGFYFIPEIGEEVLVGFEGGDAEKPYVMGSLYHGKHKPENNWVNQKNEIKAIRTQSGNTIEFIDTPNKEEIVIYLGGDKQKENRISLLSGSQQELTIFSKGKLILEAENIEIKAKENFTLNTSSGSIVLKSGKDVSMDATQLSLQAKSKVDIKGANVSTKADAQLKSEGAQVEVSGSAMTVIKGGVVKIN